MSYHHPHLCLKRVSSNLCISSCLGHGLHDIPSIHDTVSPTSHRHVRLRERKASIILILVGRMIRNWHVNKDKSNCIERHKIMMIIERQGHAEIIHRPWFLIPWANARGPRQTGKTIYDTKATLHSGTQTYTQSRGSGGPTFLATKLKPRTQRSNRSRGDELRQACRGSR